MGSSEDTSVAESATRPTSTGTPKAASCALVYSDVRHVLNINRILEDIEEALFEHGLAAQRLGRAARTGLARSVEVLMAKLGLTHRTTFVVGLEQLTRRMTRD
jgi:hypothetical protein